MSSPKSDLTEYEEYVRGLVNSKYHEFLHESGMNQTKVAEALGLTRAHVSRLLNGHQAVGKKFVEAASTLFRCSIEELDPQYAEHLATLRICRSDPPEQLPIVPLNSYDIKQHLSGKAAGRLFRLDQKLQLLLPELAFLASIEDDKMHNPRELFYLPKGFLAVLEPTECELNYGEIVLAIIESGAVLRKQIDSNTLVTLSRDPEIISGKFEVVARVVAVIPPIVEKEPCAK